MLTKRQKQVLEFIKKYITKHGYAPSLEEIKKHLRLSSVSTAHFHVTKLQEAGYLFKEDNQPRAVSPQREMKSIEIPLLGTIAAGKPIEAIEIPESITVTKDAIGKVGKHYALRVQGDSMIEDGIFNDDVVIIREQKVADNGQTVVAIINEDEATLKKFYKEKGRFRLQPANPSLSPIFTKKVELRGIVIKIIRELEKKLK